MPAVRSLQAESAIMASITIRRLDETTKKRLRIRAAERGTSMEEEARRILRDALVTEAPVAYDLATAIHRRFASLGGLELELPPREPMRRPPHLSAR
jgi:antitoxin FitA